MSQPRGQAGGFASGKPEKRECPLGCGGSFANLPAHMRACNGPSDDASDAETSARPETARCPRCGQYASHAAQGDAVVCGEHGVIDP